MTLACISVLFEGTSFWLSFTVVYSSSFSAITLSLTRRAFHRLPSEWLAVGEAFKETRHGHTECLKAGDMICRTCGRVSRRSPGRAVRSDDPVTFTLHVVKEH